MSGLSRLDAAAVAAHYGSISIVTFVAGTSVLESAGIASEGYMVAVAAAMEAPAILSALWLISRGGQRAQNGKRPVARDHAQRLYRAACRVVHHRDGYGAGRSGRNRKLYIVSPFKGVLCLFLLDMGLVAGRGLREGGKVMRPGLLAFGVVMPVIGSVAGLGFGVLLGVSTGGVMLFMVLGASASYIAVPAAMRVAVPEADPSIYLTLSLGVTFPFNLTLGLPLYLSVAQWATGG